jgi:hypothetical protein
MLQVRMTHFPSQCRYIRGSTVAPGAMQGVLLTRSTSAPPPPPSPSPPLDRYNLSTLTTASNDLQRTIPAYAPHLQSSSMGLVVHAACDISVRIPSCGPRNTNHAAPATYFLKTISLFCTISGLALLYTFTADQTRHLRLLFAVYAPFD